MSAAPGDRPGAGSPVPGVADEGLVTRRTAQDGRDPSDADPRSITELLRELSSEGADLVRQEIALAKAEMNQKVDVFQRNLLSMAVGGAILLAALLTLLWAVNVALTALLAQGMELDVAVWLSPLILTLVLAAVGWGLVSKAKHALGEEGITPNRTAATLKEDGLWVEQKARQVKEEIQHG